MNLLRILIGLALFIVGVAAADENLSGILETKPQQAARLTQAKDWKGLEAMTQKWVVLEHKNWESWNYHGIALFGVGKYQNAAGALSTAVILSPPDHFIRLETLVGDSQTRLENWQAAETAYRRVLDAEPLQPEVWDKLLTVVAAGAGKLEAETGDRSKRLEEIEVLMTMLAFGEYINNVTLWRQSAVLLDSFDRLDEAEDAYHHVLRLVPGDLPAAEWLFAHYEETGEKAALEEIQERLLRINSKHPMVYGYFADEALAEGKLQKARAYYEIAAQGKEYPRIEARALVGQAFLAASKPKALEYYLAAINADPSYLPAWEGAVIVYREQGQMKKAQRYFSRMRLIKDHLKAGRVITRDVLANL